MGFPLLMSDDVIIKDFALKAGNPIYQQNCMVITKIYILK